MMHTVLSEMWTIPFERDCFLVSALADALPLPNTPGAILGSSYGFNQIRSEDKHMLCTTHCKPMFPYIGCRETMHKSKSCRHLRSLGFGLLALGFLQSDSLIVALVYPRLGWRLWSGWLHDLAPRTLSLPSFSEICVATKEYEHGIAESGREKHTMRLLVICVVRRAFLEFLLRIALLVCYAFGR